MAKGWTPTRPILFCQSPDDRDVPIENTVRALETLGAALERSGQDPSGKLQFRPLGTAGAGISHVSGVFLAIPMAFDWIYRGLAAEAVLERAQEAGARSGRPASAMR